LIVIIGSGPGGYDLLCTTRFQNSHYRKYSTLGGTCLNVGCIPSKVIASSHHYAEIKLDHGIELTGEVKVNLVKWLLVQAVVDQTSGGVKYLMDKKIYCSRRIRFFC
jgi:dihydrolipoamide dehydrogenase